MKACPLAALFLALTLLCLTAAAESPGMSAEAYRELASTYSINSSIPAYDVYLSSGSSARPDAVITIECDS